MHKKITYCLREHINPIISWGITDYSARYTQTLQGNPMINGSVENSTAKRTNGNIYIQTLRLRWGATVIKSSHNSLLQGHLPCRDQDGEQQQVKTRTDRDWYRTMSHVLLRKVSSKHYFSPKLSFPSTKPGTMLLQVPPPIPRCVPDNVTSIFKHIILPYFGPIDARDCGFHARFYIRGDHTPGGPTCLFPLARLCIPSTTCAGTNFTITILCLNLSVDTHRALYI